MRRRLVLALAVAAATSAPSCGRPEPGRPASAATRAVPVLLFHGACEGPCPPDRPYDTPRSEIEATLEGLSARGFSTVSIADYVAWFAGGAPDLGPRRPVLVTFDDGKVDGYRAADRALARLGLRATMFVITDHAETSAPTYMTWPDVEEAARSGRWDLQLHAHRGHVRIPSAPPRGGVQPKGGYYARLWWREGGLEERDAWRARVVDDLDRGDALLAAHLPGYRSIAFAVPFEDWGQIETNDAQIPVVLGEIFDARWSVWFTQPDRDPADTAVHVRDGTHRASRYLATPSTRAEDVLAWLDRRAR